jgi:hypothetical protein
MPETSGRVTPYMVAWREWVEKLATLRANRHHPPWASHVSDDASNSCDVILALAGKDSSTTGWQMHPEQVKWLCYTDSHKVMPLPIPSFEVLELFAASDSTHLLHSTAGGGTRNILSDLTWEIPNTQLNAGSGNHAEDSGGHKGFR